MAGRAAAGSKPRSSSGLQFHDARVACGWSQRELRERSGSARIAGSEADTLSFSKNAYEKAKEPKELVIIPCATHIDLYDKPEFVPRVAEKLTQFFSAHL